MKEALLNLLKAIREDYKKHVNDEANYWFSYSIANRHGLELVVSNMYCDWDKVQVYGKLYEDQVRNILHFNVDDEFAVDLFLSNGDT